MTLSLVPVKQEQKTKLFSLQQFSLYEEIATDGNHINEDGYFDYPYFEAYFNDALREAYFIQSDITCVGMDMLHPYTCQQPGYTIAEFMILPAYRRRHIGYQAALAAVGLHPGYWEISPAQGVNRQPIFGKAYCKTHLYMTVSLMEKHILYLCIAAPKREIMILKTMKLPDNSNTKKISKELSSTI